jgi:5'-nucleotidase
MKTLKKVPSILVCNDDGIDAPGIYALATELKKLGNVTVVAPHTQQSAVGHAITMNGPLRVREYQKGGKFFGLAVEGTPADCIKLALNALVKSPPDLVVSGINHGSNTAINIIYSGTVSAATEATILGIPSMAVSLTTFEKPDFRYAAKISKRIATAVLKNGLPSGTLLNVNVPAVPEKKIKGIMITRQGSTRWDDSFEVRRDPINQQFYWLTGTMEVIDKSKDTDQIAVENNYVSVSPIHYQLTDHETLKKLKKWKF